jgi:hypothetical protein
MVSANLVCQACQRGVCNCCAEEGCFCASLRHRRKAHVSRRTHMERVVDLLGAGGKGLTRKRRTQLCWDHFWRMLWP